MSGNLDREQLEAMKRADLVALAKEMGVNTSGKNADIINRIIATEAQETTEPIEEEQIEATEYTNNVTVAAGKGVVVEVTYTFLDRLDGELKYKGEMLKVTKERANELVAANVAKLCE